MKQYLLGLFEGIMIWLIVCSFILHSYIIGTILCFIAVTANFLVLGDIANYLKLKREAKEIEDIINGAKENINKEFRGI